MRHSHLQRQHSAETVIAANIAGRLNQAQKDANRLSLAAKNLSVIAHRIGGQAAGLRTLSEFYDEFALRSIRLSEQINRLSAEISRSSVKAWRQHQLELCLEYALNQTDAANSHTGLVRQCLQRSNAQSATLRQQSQTFRRQLHQSLADLAGFMQTIKVIAVNSRIEAAQLSAYQAQLKDLSTSIDNNTNAIMSHLDFCQRELRELHDHD